MNYSNIIKNIKAEILPLLILHNHCHEDHFPDSTSCPWNVRRAEGARFSCADDDHHRNILYNLITEKVHTVNGILDASQYFCALTSFSTTYDVSAVPLKSNLGLEMNQQYYAKPISVCILNEAVRCLNPQHTNESTIESALDKYLVELSKIPSVRDGESELLNFIKHHLSSHPHPSRTEEHVQKIKDAGVLWGQDELKKINLGTSNKCDDEECTFLRRFIHENLAKVTKVIVHFSDGLHRATSYDGASSCSLPPQADKSLYSCMTEYSQDLKKREKHDTTVVNVKFLFDDNSDNLIAFGEEMLELSKKSQSTSGRQKEHSKREHAKLLLLDLKKVLDKKSYGFLLGEDNESGLPKALSLDFPFAKLPNNVGAEGLLKESFLYSDEHAHSIIFSDQVSKNQHVSKVYIQCWVNELSKIIHHVMSDNTKFSSGVLNMKSVLQDIKIWESMFKDQQGNFTLFSKGRNNSQFGFLKMQDAYSPNRYSKTYTADQFLFCQLMLMALTSNYAFTTILDCLENSNPGHVQSSSGTEVDTSLWLNSLVETILASADYSYKTWKKACFAPPRGDDPKMPLRNCDQVVYLCLISSAIGNACEFFSFIGDNPKASQWYSQLQFFAETNDTFFAETNDTDMAKFAAPMKLYLSFVVSAFILYIESTNQSLILGSPDKPKILALHVKILTNHIQRILGTRFKDGVGSITLFEESIGGSVTLDPRRAGTNGWDPSNNLVQILSCANPSAPVGEVSNENTSLVNFTHRISEFHQHIKDLYRHDFAKETLECWYKAYNKKVSTKKSKKQQQITESDEDRPKKKRPRQTNKAANNNSVKSKESTSKKNKNTDGSSVIKNNTPEVAEKTSESNQMTSTTELVDDIDTTNKVPGKTRESHHTMISNIDKCYLSVFKELTVGGDIYKALRSSVRNNEVNITKDRIDRLFKDIETLRRRHNSTGEIGSENNTASNQENAINSAPSGALEDDPLAVANQDAGSTNGIDNCTDQEDKGKDEGEGEDEDVEDSGTNNSFENNDDEEDEDDKDKGVAEDEEEEYSKTDTILHGGGKLCLNKKLLHWLENKSSSDDESSLSGEDVPYEELPHLGGGKPRPNMKLLESSLKDGVNDPLSEGEFSSPIRFPSSPKEGVTGALNQRDPTNPALALLALADSGASNKKEISNGRNPALDLDNEDLGDANSVSTFEVDADIIEGIVTVGDMNQLLAW